MIKHESFSLAGADGKTIIGDITFFDKNPDAPIVLFVHGFKGFKDWGAHHLAAHYFASNGFKYIKFNLSHSGVPTKNPKDVTDMDAFASNTVSKELFDVQAVINYIFENLTTHKQISLIGHSRGGGLSIITAANDERIKNLVTWSSIADFRSLWKVEQEEEWLKNRKIYVINARTQERMPLNKTLLEDLNQNAKKLNITKAAQNLSKPWIIIHGTDDVNVPLRIAEELHQLQPNSKLIKIEGANHVYGASHPYLEESLPNQLYKVCEMSVSFLKSSS